MAEFVPTHGGFFNAGLRGIRSVKWEAAFPDLTKQEGRAVVVQLAENCLRCVENRENVVGQVKQRQLHFLIHVVRHNDDKHKVAYCRACQLLILDGCLTTDHPVVVRGAKAVLEVLLQEAASLNQTKGFAYYCAPDKAKTASLVLSGICRSGPRGGDLDKLLDVTVKSTVFGPVYRQMVTSGLI